MHENFYIFIHCNVKGAQILTSPNFESEEDPAPDCLFIEGNIGHSENTYGNILA